MFVQLYYYRCSNLMLTWCCYKIKFFDTNLHWFLLVTKWLLGFFLIAVSEGIVFANNSWRLMTGCMEDTARISVPKYQVVPYDKQPQKVSLLHSASSLAVTHAHIYLIKSIFYSSWCGHIIHRAMICQTFPFLANSGLFIMICLLRCHIRWCFSTFVLQFPPLHSLFLTK